LSVDGSEDLAPKYLSSKESKLAAALVSEVAAAVAELPDAVALLAEAVAELALAVAEFAEAVAELAAAVADVAAPDAEVVALAASTIKSHLAESVLLVNGCEPEDVSCVSHKDIVSRSIFN